MTQIEVTFLGTTAAIPTKRRNHSSIHLKYRSENEWNYLWDCGEGTQRQMLSSDVNFMKINDIFITHWHADHFAGLFGLLETMGLEGRTEPLRIFAPEAKKFVKMIKNLGYSSTGFKVIPKNVKYQGKPKTVLEEEEFEIKSFPVVHGVPAVGFAFVEKDRLKIDKKRAEKKGLPKQGKIYKKIKNEGSAVYKDKKIKLEDISKTEKGKLVVYSGDTRPSKNLVNIANGADLLIHDCTYFEDYERKHTTFKEILKVVSETDPKKTVLTHISRRYQNMSELKKHLKQYKKIQIAKDFKKVMVS